jgi:hypothetical protein
VYSGYLSFNGVEILNASRAGAYARYGIPGIEIKCDDTGLRAALGHATYTYPSRDKAPWFQGARQATGRFYGLYPSKIEGTENSTREVDVTEKSSSGAVITAPRHASREIRVVATAFAADEEAMGEGLAWLRDVLTGEGCSEGDDGCMGRTLRMFAYRPLTRVAAHGATREFYTVEVTDGPKVRKKHPMPQGLAWEVEFTFTAGVPWAFSLRSDVATLALDEGTNFQDPAGENCGITADPYDDFVGDPFFGGIARPPKPPVILPPNILDINSWRRRTATIPSSQSQRWGRVVPYVSILTENAVQFVRLRFYRQGRSGCDFDGEFLVSYIPSTAILTLDAIRRKATLRLSDGRTVPAGHLLFGSDGRPFLWPTLGCQYNYSVTVDIMPNQPGVAVVLETAVRE